MKITSKLLLQVVVGVLGVIPLIAGGRELLTGPGHINLTPEGCNPAYPGCDGITIPDNTLAFTHSLDSEFRFLAGIWFTLGLVIYYMLFRIEKVTVTFTAVGSAIFMGGVGRVISYFQVGPPDREMQYISILELVAVPLLIYWQHRVAKAAKS